MNKKKQNKNISLLQEIKLLGKKTKSTIKKNIDKNLENSKQINSIANELLSKNITDLNDIKKFLSENKKNKNITPAVIKTILSCKFQEDKIIFKDNYFSKKLTLYFPAFNIETKYLTNDYLYLYMIFNKTILSDIKRDNKNLANLIENSTLSSVTISSQNFTLNDLSTKGIIQDYDGSASLIFSSINETGLTINNIIDQKPNLGNFELNNIKYSYYGNENTCVIAPETYTAKEILKIYQKMKFLKNENNVFTSSEQFVSVDKKIKFINKKIYPDSFCPSFWASKDLIKCNFLFEIKLDYNALFQFLDTINKNQKNISLPHDLCYWDTMSPFFDFLSVLSITSTHINPDNMRLLSDWVKGLNEIKAFSVRYKIVSLNIQQIFQDFLNAFLNNSEYKRFLFLYQKASTALDSITELKKNPDFDIFKNLLSSIPNLHYIKKQLSSIELLNTLKSVVNTLKQYCEGTNPDTIFREVINTSKSIFNLLPKRTKDRDGLFPFISAGGGLDSNLIPANNKIFQIIKNNIKKKEKTENEKKENINKISNIVDIVNKELKNFFMNHVTENTDIPSNQQDELINLLLDYYLLEKMNDKRTAILQTLDSKKKLKKSDKELLEQLCRTYINIMKGVNSDSNNEDFSNFIKQKKGNNLVDSLGNVSFKNQK